MVNLADLPPEILYNIISYLNVLDNKGTPLLRYIQCDQIPAHIGIIFHKSNPDISLFDAMRVCKLWRNLVFQLIFKEDVSIWSAERWREEIDRFRNVERLALIEMVRMFVVMWQKASLVGPVEEGLATSNSDIPVPVNAHRSGGGGEADSSVGNVEGGV